MMKLFLNRCFRERKNLLSEDKINLCGAATESERLLKETKGKTKTPKGVSLTKLFQYATSLDWCLMFLGSFFAALHGAGTPLLAIVFGGMTQHFIQQTQTGFPDSGSNTSNTLELHNETLFPKNLTSPLIESRGVFDDIDPEEFKRVMTTFSMYYVYIALVVIVASYLQAVCWCVTCERQIHRMRQEFFYQVLRQEIRWFDARQTGELAMKLNDDLERVKEGIGEKFSQVIQNVSTCFSGFVVGFANSTELTLVIMSLTPVMAVCAGFIGKMMASSSAREQQKYGVAGSIAEEALSCIRTVNSFCGQKHEIERYSNALKEAFDIAIRKTYWGGFAYGFTFLVLYGSYALAFWYGSRMIIEEKVIGGQVFTVFFAVLMASSALGFAIPHFLSITIARGSAQTIYEIIDTNPDIDAYSDVGMQPKTLKASIQLRNIYFNYPSRPGVKVLRNLSLDIKEGETIALCGHSGSGKSTIVNLLLRFYNPASGSITLGGYDIRDLNVRWLRMIIGIVSQEPILFDCSITENIQYGNIDVNFDSIVEAAKNANAHDFICALPCGYDTIVGERGAQLSGGQKQRIAIARALVRDPKILLLDEATSALDAESESVVQEALEKARQGRTTIIVAHRLSTIRNADMIYAMADGDIVEQGTHKELMEKEGLYYHLVTHQVFVDETGYSTTEFVNAVQPIRPKKLRYSKRIERVSPVTRERYINKLSKDLEKILLPVNLNSALAKETSNTSKPSRWSFRKSKNSSLATTPDDATPPEPFGASKLESVDLPSLIKILQAARPEWLLIFFAIIASIVTGGVMPTFAIFYSEIFETFTLTGDALEKAAFFWSMMFVVLAITAAISNFSRTIFFGQAGERLTMRLRQRAFASILRQHAGWFDSDQNSSGKLSTRLATDVPMMKSATGPNLGVIIAAIASLGTSLSIAYAFGWKLALCLTATLPLLMATGNVNMKSKRGNQTRDALLLAEAGRVVTEGIENIRTVQALTLEPIFLEKFILNLLQPYRESRKNALVNAITIAISEGMVFFMYALAFRLGSVFVSNGDMKAVDVYRVVFTMALSAVWIGQYTSFLPDVAKAKLSAGFIFQLIEKEPEIDSLSPNGMKPRIRGEVTLSDLHFRYPNRSDVPVLRGLNLNVQPGKTMALVGPSGCGKSTVVSLVQRFYDPQEGTVKVDDFDIRTLNLAYLRSHIAVVSQEPALFNCSVRDNITYGLEETIPQGQIEAAARNANVHDFIQSLPKGYDTTVGEKGTQLSGGQKQRIAIARALVRNPKILLLDEATSALDTESEKLVQDAIDKARKGRTCIVIAHRLSTIQTADCITIIDRGVVTEQGTHEELIWKKGAYYRLIKKQRIKH